MPVIYLPKWFDVLVMLYNMPDEEKYYQKLYRKLNLNSSHVRTMIHHLERHCFIKRIPQKKIRYIVLTQKGLALAELALRLKFILKQVSLNEE